MSVNHRILTLADVDRAAEVVSTAFREDPFITYMLPFRRSRWRTLKKFFRSYGKISIENQTGYGVGKPLKGVAFWRAPHQKEISINLKSLSIFLPLLFSYYPIGYFRARPLNQQTDALHQLHAIQPHYYLENIGVLPAEQGKGFASQLMRPILERADAEHVIVYTDTSTRSNVSFYEHFGFECVEERAVEGTGVTIYAMRRDIPC